jgi:hypothetical protein
MVLINMTLRKRWLCLITILSTMTLIIIMHYGTDHLDTKHNDTKHHDPQLNDE